MQKLIDEKYYNRLAEAKKVAVLTGAGISAESGIPTFRGENGLWKKLSPMELASFEAFYKNTSMVNEWYKHRREIINSKEPNAGHYALVELEKIAEDFTLITQNIDRLHHRAGSSDVIELHGNIKENYCIRCGKDYSSEEFDEIYESTPDHIPRCWCGGLIRPNVIWYGESLPEDAIQEAYKVSIASDLFLSIGTSAEVRPASDLPRYARSHGALLIEINPYRTSLSEISDICLKGAAGEILPRFVEEYSEIAENKSSILNE